MLLHTEAFTHRHLYTRKLLRTDTFTHIGFYTRTLLHTDTFTHRRFCTQTLLHTDAFTHRSFHAQRLLHADTFTRRRFYTQTLLRRDAFTHIEAFTHRSFYTQTLLPQKHCLILTSIALDCEHLAAVEVDLSTIQWIGLREQLQENPISKGNLWFPLDFPLNQSIEPYQNLRGTLTIFP